MKENLEEDEPVEIQPFNSAAEHYQKIMGMPNKAVDYKSMPKPIRWFGYFVAGFICCGVLAMIIINLFF